MGRARQRRNIKNVRRGRRPARHGRQAVCRFCREKVKEVDYKEIGALQRLLTARGKIFSRSRSGNCAKHQRSAKRAIKQARHLALLPFVS